MTPTSLITRSPRFDSRREQAVLKITLKSFVLVSSFLLLVIDLKSSVLIASLRVIWTESPILSAFLARSLTSLERSAITVLISSTVVVFIANYFISLSA